jgi:hypothetical protein
MPTQYVGQATLAQRLREVREELFGEEGVPLLAEALHLPARTWRNYEEGVNIPARVLLRFADISGSSPLWLLTGKGGRYLKRDPLSVPVPSVAVSRHRVHG